MRLVIQRVEEASVKVGSECSGKIGKGLLVFLGVGSNDTKETALKYLEKLIKLRIFADSEGKTNCSIADVHGELLIVSQFTLYADCKKGNRPNFLLAAEPQHANALYEFFIDECRKRIPKVETGQFGTEMKVESINDGPFTIVLDEFL